MYIVTNNGIYTNEAQTKEQIIEELKEGDVNFRKARRSNDYELIVANGCGIGKAFYTQSGQIKYLKEIGIL